MGIIKRNSVIRARGIGTIFLFAFMVSLSIAMPSARAYSTGGRSDVKKGEFPVEGVVARQVDFWSQIFIQFSSTTTLIHDSHNPDNIIDVIDHKLRAKNFGGKISGPIARSRINSSYQKRYVLALNRFRKLGERARKYGPIEQRIFNVYSRSSEELKRLYKGRVSIRSQTGLADEFIRAAERAQDYLPYMERAFNEKSIPSRISRLAFVESMFNLNAKSKVGASGIWQFMPGTAKSYMHVNRYIDERNSPFKASKGAARLLADNYSALGSWPLAITAYNHGRGGMKKATRMVGSRNLDRIIRNYRSKTFGFASRNFYAEYIAAARAYDTLLERGHARSRPSSLKLASIRLKDRLSIHQLLRYTPLTSGQLKKNNQGIKRVAFGRGKYRLLPASFEIFVPMHMAGKMKIALKRIKPSKKYAYRTKRQKGKSRK